VYSSCEAAGQLHLLEEWDSLNEAERQELLKDVKVYIYFCRLELHLLGKQLKIWACKTPQFPMQGLDFAFIKHALDSSLAAAAQAAHLGGEPVKDVVTLQVGGPQATPLTIAIPRFAPDPRYTYYQGGHPTFASHPF
jgi:hypothetical protein